MVTLALKLFTADKSEALHLSKPGFPTLHFQNSLNF